MGEDPVSVEVGRLGVIMDEVKAVGEVLLGVGKGGKRVKFDLDKDLVCSVVAQSFVEGSADDRHGI